MAYIRSSITGNIECRNNALYVCINFYDEEKTRRRRHINTGCNPRNERTRAKEILRQLLTIVNDKKYYKIQTILFKIIDSLNRKNRCLDIDEFLMKIRTELDNRVIKSSLVCSKVDDIDPKMLFSDYMKRWLLTKKDIEDNTYSSYKYMIESSGRIADYFDDYSITLEDLCPEYFEDYYEYLYENNLTKCTVSKHHRLMHQALKYAVKKGVVPYNMLQRIDPPKSSEFIGDYYKACEALELLKKSKDDPMYIAILLATYYGFRRSEILGLRWSCIDFDNMIINVERKVIKVNIDGEIIIQDKKKLKSKSSRRSLPLIPIVAAELKAEYQRQQERKSIFANNYYSNPDGRICVSHQGYPLTPDYITCHFKLLLTNLGLRIIRFHDLRHTCATLLVMHGISLLSVSKWLGHSTLAITEKFYLHFDVKSQIELANKMGEILSYPNSGDVKDYLSKYEEELTSPF